MTKSICNAAACESATIATAYDTAHGSSDLDIVPATWNVLPRHASRDEVDVHWLFNWAEGDMSPVPLLNPWERGCIGKRVQTNERTEIAELPGVRRAAARSSRVRSVLLALDPIHISALARWSAPPARFPQAVRSIFGRLSAVTALTAAFDRMGGTLALLDACARVTRPKTTNAADNQRRHEANEQLACVRAQAEALLAAAFAAFGTARGRFDAEASRVAMLRARTRAPASAQLLAANDVERAPAAGAHALAMLMGKARG